MRPLEDELRKALRRRQPPAGFAARVLACVRQQAQASVPRRERWAWFGRRVYLGLAAAAAALLLAFSFSLWRQHRQEQQRREGEAARAQVMEALRIASVKLNRVRAKVQAVTGEQMPERTPERQQDQLSIPIPYRGTRAWAGHPVVPAPGQELI